MQVVYEGFNKIILIDGDKKETIFPYVISFDVYDDKIIVNTEIKNTEIKRGWIGDLWYETTEEIEVTTGKDTGLTYKDCFKDVILISVNPTVDSSNVVAWEYCFLKK